MAEIIEFKRKSDDKQKTKYTAERFRNIAMDQALAKILSNTIIQHLKSTSLELDKERFDLILNEITKNITNNY